MAMTEPSCRAFRDFWESFAAIDIDAAHLTSFPGAKKVCPAKRSSIWLPVARDTSLGVSARHSWLAA